MKTTIIPAIKTALNHSKTVIAKTPPIVKKLTLLLGMRRWRVLLKRKSRQLWLLVRLVIKRFGRAILRNARRLQQALTAALGAVVSTTTAIAKTTAQKTSHGLHKGAQGVVKAARGIVKVAKSVAVSSRIIAPLAAIGSTIRTTITWTKTRIQRIVTRHKLFIATSVSYRDALAGAMALIAALFGMRKEIATLVGLAVSSLQRFFAQRTFIDDAQEDEDDDGFEGLQGWRPQPSW